MLPTGDVPLSPGFVQWRDMCAKKPEYDVARLFARGNPHLSAAECDAYNAPFPDRGHREALRALPAMVPEHPDDPGADLGRQARRFWANEWQGTSWMVVGTQDPVLGPPVMAALHHDIRGCPPPHLLPEAGHFVPEHGEALAHLALTHFAGLAKPRPIP